MANKDSYIKPLPTFVDKQLDTNCDVPTSDVFLSGCDNVVNADSDQQCDSAED